MYDNSSIPNDCVYDIKNLFQTYLLFICLNIRHVRTAHCTMLTVPVPVPSGAINVVGDVNVVGFLFHVENHGKQLQIVVFNRVEI